MEGWHISEYFGATVEGDPFHWLALSHVVMLGVFVVSVILLFSFRKKGRKRGNGLRYTLALFLLISELSLYGWYVYTGVWDPVDSLPFQLCSISLLLSVVMLLTRNYFLFEVTYFLGIGGALQALLTPELYYDFPHYRYFHFFLAHIAIILANLYMVWHEDYRPTFTSVWKAFASLNVLAGIVYFINKVTGGNYMFLASKPTNPSLLDYMGPYPWYILALELVTLVIFIMLYVPFIRKK